MTDRTSDLVLILKGKERSSAQQQTVDKVLRILGLVVVYAFLAFIAILFLFPFYWMVITSLKTGEEIQLMLPGMTMPSLWPQIIAWSNFTDLFGGRFNFGLYMGNTLIVGIISTLGTLVTTVFAAYAFARLEFKGKNLLFVIFLATMMIPGEMMVITNYITVSNLGMVSNNNIIGGFAAMIVPFWVSVFYIYLLRQNMKQVPNELYLAAKVDGKSDWNFLWHVMVPLVMPSLVTITILKLMGAWNGFVWPQLIASGNEKLYLISVGLRMKFSSDDIANTGRQMAASTLVTAPLLLVFIFFRKYIMRGVGRAGIKG